MTFKLLLSLCVFATLNSLNTVASARILGIIGTASYSHQVFYQQFWRELALRGHDITVITSHPTNETLPNFKEISISENCVHYKTLIDRQVNVSLVQAVFGNEVNILAARFVEHQLAIPAVAELIHNKSERFDLLMIEHFATPYHALKDRYKCPLIGLMTLDGFSFSHEVMGNPTHPILYPNSVFRIQEDLSLTERVTAVVFYILFAQSTAYGLRRYNEVKENTFGKDVPYLGELFEQLDLLFINANPIFTPIRPLTPSTINLAGGLHLLKPKPLPNDIQKFPNLHSNGVIYFSFGSTVRSKDLSAALRQTIMKTLSQLPYHVLWKFENDTLPGKPKNVIIRKWFPQQDLLRHPNMKLFITQGGIQSLEEALYSHIPVVVIPFLGDQDSNGAKIKSKKLGLTLNRDSLTVADFKAAILEVIDNPVYKENMQRLAIQIQDQPMTPLEKAIWWTEYVLRHKGAQHLKGPTIPWWQYYYFDVLVVLGGVLVLLASIPFILFKVLKHLCCKRNHVMEFPNFKKKIE